MHQDSEMNQYINTQVTFKITGDGLDPEEITAILNLTPSNSHKKGDKVIRHPDQHYSSGYWGFESPLAVNRSLVDHLNYLIEIMESKTESVKKINERELIPCFYCGVFTSKMPEISLLLDPNLLGRIAELGAQLQIQFYVDSE